ncbi:MAG: hypothetical protein ACI3T9_05055 [Romboutsia timonensis]
MLKKLINEELKKLESDDFMKDIEMKMLDFLSDFSLEGNDLVFTFRKYRDIDGMINTSDSTICKWDVFRVLMGKINADILEDEMDKVFLRYVQAENELADYLLEHQELSKKVVEINDIADKIFEALRESNIELQWHNKHLGTFELLKCLSAKGDADKTILDIIKSFKVPSKSFEEIWMSNVPNEELLAMATIRVIDRIGEDNEVTEDDISNINDKLMDVIAEVDKVIIMHILGE